MSGFINILLIGGWWGFTMVVRDHHEEAMFKHKEEKRALENRVAELEYDAEDRNDPEYVLLKQTADVYREHGIVTALRYWRKKTTCE